MEQTHALIPTEISVDDVSRLSLLRAMGFRRTVSPISGYHYVRVPMGWTYYESWRGKFFFDRDGHIRLMILYGDSLEFVFL